MKRHVLEQPHVSHPNVTPLIDIVMCMVIFFMMVAKIGVTTGADPTIEVPVSTLSRALQIESLSNTLVLNVREKRPLDEPLVTALVDGASGQPQEIRVRDPASGKSPLLEVLRRLRYGRDGRPGGTGLNADNDDFRVIIRGDKEMGYRFLEPVLVACAQANVGKVIYQTRARTELVQETP
ncbi:MAG: biopolymer transporter ExbD [Phycisphaerae bacterium]|nr:biopolymer transporter ExbD [Phycisphaerae bacterium]MDW8261406.1 biopolymer transporter ExbD [Phycisphaerales bacterium]